MASPSLSDEIQALLAKLPSIDSAPHPECVDAQPQVNVVPSPQFGNDLDAEANISDEESFSPPVPMPGSGPSFFTLPLDSGHNAGVLENAPMETGSRYKTIDVHVSEASSWLSPEESSTTMPLEDTAASLAAPLTMSFLADAPSSRSSSAACVSDASRIPMRQQLCTHSLPHAECDNMSPRSEETAADSSRRAPFGCHSRASPVVADIHMGSCPESPLRRQMREHPPPRDESDPDSTLFYSPSRGEFPLQCQMHTQRSTATFPTPEIAESESVDTTSQLRAGGYASLTGLKTRHELNGEIAKLLCQLEDSDDKDSRWMVVLDDGHELTVRFANLLAISPTQPPARGRSSLPSVAGESLQSRGKTRSPIPQGEALAWLGGPSTPPNLIAQAAPHIDLESGSKVRIMSLGGRADLNGRIGTLLQPASSESPNVGFPDRWLVALDGPSAEELMLSATNLERLDPTPLAKAPQTTLMSTQGNAVSRGTRGPLPLPIVVLLTLVVLSVGILLGAYSHVQDDAVDTDWCPHVDADLCKHGACQLVPSCL